MTDNEIIKALECRVKDKFPECPYFHSYPCDKCKKMQTDAFDLINRQKAENKSQSIMIKMLKGSIEDYKNSYINQKAEIERLRESRDRWRKIAEDFDRFSREEERMLENDKERT
jgi:hypothetical protein